MASKTYKLKPALGTIKQGFSLEDENGTIIYNGKMTKFKLFGAAPFEFTNNITNKKEEHNLGKVVTQTESGMLEALSIKSSFKFDGENIWDYLHKKGIRIKSDISSGKIGMTYEVSFEGNKIATIESSTPKGKSRITTGIFYDVTCEEKDLDLVFLVAFSIARTDQITYD